jgi:hypothetical protein
MLEKPIQKNLAFSLIPLILANVPYARKIAEELSAILSINIDDLIKEVSKKPERFFEVDSRHKTSKKIIEESGIRQVIEIAAGFTPHALNLRNCVDRYIEIDLPQNSELKSQAMKRVDPTLETIYVSGDAFEEDTWNRVKINLLDQPTIVFSEGFILYTDAKNRAKMLEFIKPIIINGLFFHEDCRTINGVLRKEEYKELGFTVNRQPTLPSMFPVKLDKKFEHWILKI